jgi:hypothetical protein
MSKKARPELTNDAKRQLENDKATYGWWIVNEAEKHALSEGRNEVSDGDIKEVKKPFPPIYTSKRIWFIRFLLGLMAAALLSMIEAFSELSEIEIRWLFLRLVFPTVFVFVGIIVFAYIFRDSL